MATYTKRVGKDILEEPIGTRQRKVGGGMKISKQLLSPKESH